MNKSGETKNLAAALIKAQSEMGQVNFDSNNPFFKSKYASLGAVIDHSKKALENNGLTVSQLTATNEFGIGITTLLMHVSGEYIESTATVPLPDKTYVDKNGETKQNNLAQEAGKIITYLRRYSLASLLNLYSDEDTDGEQKKVEHKQEVRVPESQKQPEPKEITPELQEALNLVGSDDKAYKDCTVDELKRKLIGITKVLNDKSRLAEHTMYKEKLDQVKLVIDYKS